MEKIIKIENQELFSKLSQHLTKFSLQEIKKVPQADFTQLIHILKTIIKLSSKVLINLPCEFKSIPFIERYYL